MKSTGNRASDAHPQSLRQRRYNLRRVNAAAGNVRVEAVRDEVRTLVDRYRSWCLWFLRPDYYPQTDGEVLRVLMYLERYGDRDAFTRAASLRRWLSPRSERRVCRLIARHRLESGESYVLEST
jgi:hypothetical protein